VFESFLEGVEVDPEILSQRRFNDPARIMRDEGVKRCIDRGVDDNGVTWICDQPQDFDDAHHHVGHDGGALDRQPVPAPAPGSESTYRLRELRPGRVSGVSGIDGPVQRFRNGRREPDVHLRNPQRQDVGGMSAPFHARALA